MEKEAEVEQKEFQRLYIRTKEDLKSFRIWEECYRTNNATMASDRSSWKAKINSGASLHQLTWENQRTENSEKKKNRKNLAELG